MEFKNRVEALLFASADGVTAEDLARICQITMVDDVHKYVSQLRDEFKQRDSPLMIIKEGNLYRMSVGERYLDVVQRITSTTELDTSTLETLAVIAWRQPILQSAVIKIRSTKAYEHIAELEDKGFIVRERSGRSYLLKVTQKFNEYFDLPTREAVKDLFKDFDEEIANRVLKKPGQQTLNAPASTVGGLEVYGEGERKVEGNLGGLETYGPNGELLQPQEGQPEQLTASDNQEPVGQEPTLDSHVEEQQIQTEQPQSENAPMQFDVDAHEDVQVAQRKEPVEQPEQSQGFSQPQPEEALAQSHAHTQPHQSADPHVRTPDSFVDVNVAQSTDDQTADDIAAAKRAEEILENQDAAVYEENTNDPNAVRLGPYPVEQAKYELEGVQMNQRAKSLMNELTGDNDKNLSFMTERATENADAADTDSEIESKQKQLEAGHSNFDSPSLAQEDSEKPSDDEDQGSL